MAAQNAALARPEPLPVEPPDLSTSDKCRQFVEQTIARIHSRSLHPSMATAIFQGVNLAVRIGELQIDAQLAAMLAEAEEEARRHGRGAILEAGGGAR